ncbi:MAG TPA: STAS domain-containing protein [bacterium]|nr:STAS domain-containing protein [bacterium]
MEQPIRIQVLRLRGELNLEDMLKIKTLVGEYLKAGLVHVVLNLENVTHVHLAGLPVLGERAQRLREYGGDFKLVGVSPYLRHIFELAGVSGQFDFCRSEEEASNRFCGIQAAA